MASLTGIDEETRRFYKTVVELDIKPSGLGDEPLAVDGRRMGRWMNELAERKWNKVKLMPSTIDGRRIVVSMMFGAAFEEQLIPRNPMKKVKNPAGALVVEPIDPRELPTPEQVWHLHDIAAKVAPLFAEQIIVTAGTGVRPGSCWACSA